MATVMPIQRKQDFSQSDQYYIHSDEGMQHPLSPHTTSKEQRCSVPIMSFNAPYSENADQSDSMQFTHPLSPHATCPDQDPAQLQTQMQAQRSSPVHSVKPAANVVVDQNPLSPHTTPFHQVKQRTHSVSTTDSNTSGQPNFTPSETSTAATSTGTSGQAVDTTARPKTILLINGPNLNLLGHREPHIYGHTTLTDITTNLGTFAKSKGIQLQHFQSNHESQILDRIHACLLGTLPTPQSSAEYNASASHTTPRQEFNRPDAIIINPGAFTHTSVALRDALLGVSVPYVEVHISNVHAREEFRHKSFLSDKAVAVIAGLGVSGYEAAVRFWAEKWESGK